MQPMQVANTLVDRFLAGEVMTVAGIAAEFHMDRDDARKAVQYTRDVLLDKYNVVLPIANWQGDWLLAITTSAVDAFYGELPQIRALRTRERNLIRRLHGTFALVRTRPRMAAKVLSGLEKNIAALEGAIDIAETYIEDEIEAGG